MSNSAAYLARPVTLSRPSRRSIGKPVTGVIGSPPHAVAVGQRADDGALHQRDLERVLAQRMGAVGGTRCRGGKRGVVSPGRRQRRLDRREPPRFGADAADRDRARARSGRRRSSTHHRGRDQREFERGAVADLQVVRAAARRSAAGTRIAVIISPGCMHGLALRRVAGQQVEFAERDPARGAARAPRRSRRCNSTIGIECGQRHGQVGRVGRDAMIAAAEDRAAGGCRR